LLHLVLERATEWDRWEGMSPMPPDVLAALEREGRTRNRRLLEHERRENEALYTRRHEAISQAFVHDRSVKGQRLRTAESLGNKRMLPACRGQLQGAEAEYQRKTDELESPRCVSLRLSGPVAICCVAVIRYSARARPGSETERAGPGWEARASHQ